MNGGIIRHSTLLLSLLPALLSLPGRPSRAVESDAPTTVAFTTDIRPLLTKLGCNSGGCHGKASGQNGFKISLLGFEPEVDYNALVKEARGRRLFPAAPDFSLLLLKASGQIAHGGGKRMEIGRAHV